MKSDTSAPDVAFEALVESIVHRVLDERGGVGVARLLSTAEVAELLGCSASRVQQLVQSGDLIGIEGIARGWRFTLSSVEAYIDSLDRPGDRR